MYGVATMIQEFIHYTIVDEYEGESVYRCTPEES